MKTIIANWKMNKTTLETKEFIQTLKVNPVLPFVNTWIAPPFTSLFAASNEAAGSPIKIGAQNMSAFPSGAYTGEISVLMLHDVKAQFVILGHSERRTLFQESEAMISKKCELALKSNLKIVLCVGETKEQRAAGQTEKVIKEQLKSAFESIDSQFFPSVLIAYEPLWAIGTGDFAKVNNVEEIHHLCKNVLASDVPVLYGGSVSSKNCSDYLKSDVIDGLLVGGASLDVNSFSEILKIASNCK